MKAKFKKIIFLVIVLQLCACFTLVRADIERDISLDEIPADILDAVKQEKPGLNLRAAEAVLTETLIMYEIEAEYNGNRIEILVDPEGKMLKVKNENCDDTDR